MTTPTALHESVLWHARCRPGAPAVATPTARLTYLDLAERASELAARLVAAGLRPGDRATIALPNVPATVVAGLALGMVGATSVEVNRAWGVDVLAQVLRSSGSRHLFMWSRDVSRWTAALQGVDVDAIWVVHPGAAPRASLSSLAPRVVTCVQDDGLVDPKPASCPAGLAACS